MAGLINTHPQNALDYLLCSTHGRRHLQCPNRCSSPAATAPSPCLPGHSAAEQQDSSSCPLARANREAGWATGMIVALKIMPAI